MRTSGCQVWTAAPIPPSLKQQLGMISDTGVSFMAFNGDGNFYGSLLVSRTL